MYQFRLSGFADEAGIDADEQMNVLEKNGIHQLELRSIDGKGILELDDAALEALAEKFMRRGFSVSSIGSPIGKSPIEADFSLVRASFEKVLKAAEILKAPYIRGFDFYIPGDSDPLRWADEVVYRVSELVMRAKDRGVAYALENESGIFSSLPERCVYVLDRVPNLVMAFDPGNFIMNDASPWAAWPLLKSRTAYFHIKDATNEPKRFVPAGEGDGGMDKILKDAFESGFDGVLSVEPHLGYRADLNDAQRFTTAANALKRLLNRLFHAGFEELDPMTFCKKGEI
ncbi:MAG: sugar phosphate isomerase/epimerase [Treponema sp.]|nr:sugar phosphate isomerase/epimerase [Treponema sp.]